MKKIGLKLFAVALLGLILNPLHAGSDIGKVYGEKTWIAYVGSGNGIFIRRGNTSFATKCDTGFVLKGDYVLGRDGKSYTSNKSVLTAIQRKLVRGKLGTCR